MENNKDSIFIKEKKRCDYTIKYVNKTLNNYIQNKIVLDENLESTFKRLSSDSSQDYVDILAKVGIQKNMDIKIKELYKAKTKPYFARIDFSEYGKNNCENHYIGKLSLMRDEDQEVIIVDWRAPVANLYYEERLGEVNYNCPEGNIKGELRLKRQIIINEGKLESVFDIDITTNDDFLQQHLGANSNDRLKEIVSTIQTEQNKIIRADMWKPLIVQGAAGSGKTTIALHRIAYLIYTYDKKFEPENFMILAPTKFFLNYISEILPDLGVDKVKQTTFEDISMGLLRKKFKIKDPNEKLSNYINSSSSLSKQSNLYLEISNFKSSFRFKQTIDLYLKEIEDNFIPKEDFKLANNIILTYEYINNLFLTEYKRLSFVERISEIKKHLNINLKKIKNSLIEKLELKYTLKVNKIKDENKIDDNVRSRIRYLIEEKETKLSQIEKLSKTNIKNYTNKIKPLKPWEYYKKVLIRTDIIEKIISNEDFIKSFVNNSSSFNIKKEIDIEDIAPILYIKYKIYGIEDKIPVKHIVIDEAQDFSVFQFYILKNIIKDSSFTILGDICQGIYSYRGTSDWQNIKDNVFGTKKCEIMYLEQCYRTTVEIMNVANGVIKNLKNEDFKLAKPVIRHGENVKYIKADSINKTVKSITRNIQSSLEKDYKLIAIICKTLEECEKFYILLKNYFDNIYILTGKEEEYFGGIVIIPVYLAKGLEFDIVFISNANFDVYRPDENLEIKLLYVAITRAMHELYIYYNDNLTNLLT
ncbi:MAG: RNA polymerase recycling motor HelD [Clostridiales bacterium]